MAEAEHGFGAPFIDQDEWRDQPRRHRYVHGGFEGTHTRFSFYFPPEELYDGRFYQYLEGGAGGHEILLATGGYPGMGFEWIFDVAFDDLGGYLVESNQGHFHNEGIGFANDIELFGASAESAKYSKVLAEEMYGRAPHHGYVWGGSGGGSRSIHCIENAPEVYDGASPHVINSGGLGQQWSAVAFWWLHARHQLRDIVDAMSPGGSGDPFATLTNDQREALAVTYRHGYPRGAESQLWCFSPWMWPLVAADGDRYYSDFWNTRGYLGHDNPVSIAHLVVDRKATIGKVIRATEMSGTSLAGAMAGRLASAGAVSDQNVAITLDKDLPDNTQLFGSKFTFLTGEAKGRSVFVTYVDGSVLTTSGEMHAELFDGVLPGDEVHIDNHVFIAYCYSHRYNVELDSFSVVDPMTGVPTLAQPFKGVGALAVDRKPIYPQRVVAAPPSGRGAQSHSGVFTGKMIHVNATHDSMVWPPGVANYRGRVVAHLGERIDEQYRLWWVDNAPHGAPEFLGPAVTAEKDPGIWRSRLVGYDGVTAQALRDLTRWVEDGIEPPASTGYHFTDESGLVLDPSLEGRGGVQPLVGASANGAERADVKVGETVHFQIVAHQPAGTGTIVSAGWDFEGTGATSLQHEVDGNSAAVTLDATFAYSKPGTYFASARVGGHRDGAKGRGPAAENLARVRVVVS